MFDPGKVERKEGMTWNLSEHGGRECVLATDYDQLLERYNLLLTAEPARVVPFRDGFWVFAKEYSFFTKRPDNGQNRRRRVG
jgi:hypothetical protein